MFTHPEGWNNFIDTLKTDCDGQISCSFEYSLFEAPYLSEACQAESDTRSDPNSPINQVVMLRVPCFKEEYVAKLGSLSWTVKREHLGLYIAFFDLGVCACGLLFWIIVYQRQREYVDEFKAQ